MQSRRHRRQLDGPAAGLLEKETPDTAEVAAVFGPAPTVGEDPSVGMVPKQPATAQA